ncbi:MAG: hypothetical protein ACI4UK_04570, partial [Floccifex sp.]
FTLLFLYTIQYNEIRKKYVKKEKDMKIIKKLLNSIFWIVLILLVFTGLLLIQVGKWIPSTFGDIPFEQVVFHLLIPLEGTDNTFVNDFIQTCLPVPLEITLGFILFIWISHCHKKSEMITGNYSKKSMPV